MASPELPRAVSGDLLEHRGEAGPLAYYVAGEGPPMLLLHSINAAASAIEMKPIHERLKKRFRIYTPDLPGFGHSDRSKRRYDIALFTAAVRDMMGLIAEEHGDTPIHGVGMSLSSEFLTRAAVEAQHRFATLTLITPTGLTKSSDTLRQVGETREIPGFSAIFEFPLWRGALYWLLTRKSSIRYFLKRTFGRPDVNEEMVDYDFLSAQQPGAPNAPFAFLSGRLFSKDIRLLYEKLSVPVWVPHATRGDFSDFRGADFARDRDNWRVQPFESGALVHYDQPEEFFASFENFVTQTG